MGVIIRRAAFIVALALISVPTTAQALTCAMPKIVAFSLCQEDSCLGGFKTENLSLGNCKSRPVVRELTDGERANFRDIIQRFEQEPNGIFQMRIDSHCLRHGWVESCGSRPSLRDDLTDEERAKWRDDMQRAAQGTPDEIARAWAYPSCIQYGYQDERCLAEGTVTRLAESDDLQTLAQYRTEWLAQERQAHRLVTFQHWSLAILMSSFTLLSLAWPWLLIALKASLKRFIVFMTVAAIPGQVFIFWVLEHYRIPQVTGVTVEWPQLALGCEALILLLVPLQFICLIRRKLRPAVQ